MNKEKRKKQTTYICIIYLICNIYCIYLICNIYCIYLICILYILYITYICRVKSEWLINRTSFIKYIVEPMWPLVLRITSLFEDAMVQYQVES